jgi:hypothetical protein
VGATANKIAPSVKSLTQKGFANNGEPLLCLIYDSKSRNYMVIGVSYLSSEDCKREGADALWRSNCGASTPFFEPDVIASCLNPARTLLYAFTGTSWGKL